MASDGQEPAYSGTPRYLRFSLLALLLFVTVICIALAWLVQPNRVVATALFEVMSSPQTFLSDELTSHPNDQEFEILKKTQLAKIKSNYVLTAAIRNPGVASLPILKRTNGSYSVATGSP